MLQDSFKSGVENVSAFREKLEAQLRPQFDSAAAELKKVLREMGAEPGETTSLADVISQIRARNPSFRQLALRFDIATYDVRQKLRWNASMMSAYLSDRAGQTFEAELKPKLQYYRDSAESRAKGFIDQLRDLRTTASVDSADKSE